MLAVSISRILFVLLIICEQTQTDRRKGVVDREKYLAWTRYAVDDDQLFSRGRSFKVKFVRRVQLWQAFYVYMEDGSDDEDISWVLGCKEGIRKGMCLFAGLCCLVDAF